MTQTDLEPFWPFQEAPSDPSFFDNYHLESKIGQGRNAVVCSCKDTRHGRTVAMKLYKEADQKRIEREIAILKHLDGGPNIIPVLDVWTDPEGAKRGLLLELVETEDFRSLFPRLRNLEVRYYTSELLKALRFCHGEGVMHRDVRPHNLAIDRKARKLRLIGWGSARFCKPEKEHRLLMTPWKAPELLLDQRKQDCSLDMWAFGTMLASMVFRREPFFHGVTRSDQLVRISRVLGTERLFEYVNKYDIELDEEDIEKLVHVSPRPWSSFVHEENAKFVSEEAIDLLDQLLRYDPQERLTAEQALQHAYFEPVRE